VLAVGGPGVQAALVEAGLEPLPAGDDLPAVPDSVDGVMQGFGRDIGWRSLARAAFAVSTGVPWVATNVDLTIPVAGGIAPGNGTLVAAVAAAAGRQPDQVAGKPYPAILRLAAERLQASSPLVVGDRIDTDIEGAQAAGMPALLVLTGVSGALDLWRAAPEQRPTFLSRDLSGLALPPITAQPADDGGEVRSGDALARLASDGELEVVADDPLGGMWAAARLVWSLPQEPPNLAQVAQALDAAVAALPM
jgi:ribonucleotide monophosphatase NagD (HAD superfamily)